MKANELRIGNYVGFGSIHTGVGQEISFAHYTVNQLTEQCMFFKESGVGEYYKDVQPIPLTEEWLLKLGFEKIGTNYQKGWFLLHGNIKTGTIDFLLNEPYSGKFNATVLQYVHQLQNLYFALTGNELTI